MTCNPSHNSFVDRVPEVIALQKISINCFSMYEHLEHCKNVDEILKPTKKKKVFSGQLVSSNQLILFYLTAILILCEKQEHNKQMEINGIRIKMLMTG